MPLPQPPSNPPPGPSAGAPPPGGPAGGPPPGGAPGGAPGGDGGQEVINAIKVLTMFAQAQKQQGNDGPAQAMQMLVHSLSGQEKTESPMEQKMPHEEMDKGQMPMNAAKGATPVM